MKTILKISILCGIIVLMAFSCEKEKPEVIELLVELVNDNNEVKDTFNKGDSVFFSFYLINNMGREITYRRPGYELFEFLKVFKQNFKGDYEYIGRPSVYFVPTNVIKKVNDTETKLIGSIPLIGDLNWPEMNTGNYYVGDTLNLYIDSERHQFESRIYFIIE